MDERGSAYAELIVSLLIFSMIIVPSVSYFRLLSEQAERVTKRWEAYWYLTESAEIWISGNGSVEASRPGLHVQMTEYESQPGIMKGVFVVHWAEQNENKSLTLYVHKRALP